jgi:D-alanine-D-alanine ligase-like ATP-grasp enzyme
MFTQGYCEECGEAPIPHRLEKITHIIDDFFQRSWLTKGLVRQVEQNVMLQIGSAIPISLVEWFLERGASLRILSKSNEAREGDNTRTIALYEGAVTRNVRLVQYMLGTLPLCFIAHANDGSERRVLFTVIPRPRGFASPSLPWMDDKGILKIKMRAAGIPCADGGVARSWKEARAIWERLGRVPVIIKPARGSRGRHTTLNMRTEEEVRRGYDIGMQITTAVVLEKYLHGTVHRVTLVGGEPIAIARREYPHVMGDGAHTVDELIDIENNNPKRNGIHFRKLDRGHRAPAALKKQGLTLVSVPAKGEKVILNDKNSRLHGTTTEDITDSVHPDNLKLFRKFATFLGDPIVGVDFMIDDMTRPWTEQPDAGVLECNAMPFIDVHHQVISGRKINVAAHLWDVVFAPQKSAPDSERLAQGAL